jgi:hypothetical protein
MFLDGANAKARDAVHVVFAGKEVRDDYPAPVPEIDDWGIGWKLRSRNALRLIAWFRAPIARGHHASLT